MSFEVSPNALARCATHPEELAGATCQRCGVFVCTACTAWVMGTLYCAPCAARPEVNYLETFRRGLWGKRDSRAWLVGGGCLLMAPLLPVALSYGRVLTTLGLLATVVVGVAWFEGRRWARYALPLVPLGLGLLAVPLVGPPVLGLALIPFINALQLLQDTRCKLFFRVEVSERELLRLWDREVNNPMARSALSLGLGAVFLPLFAPLAIVFGFLALRRVDLKARPPIDRRAQAIAGIVLGVGALALWVLVVIPLFGGGIPWFFRA
ncbi:DUF4190 domain-containing protein [Pyxidicoccus trucidator]|uniref:DUF4190 domain-containing protein n=1 Tax=Pyxidicoccus trucidator TaxID=2709662 RepID=UPI0013D91457|nr:DUF4190 domain-containing protein [Pyxidicoccus trucidator]